MNKTHTLKELADMFAYERRRALNNCQSVEQARLLALKRVLDAVGYEFPKDEEREAFDAWYQAAQIPQGETQAFAAWKAGRELLRKEVCSDQCEDNSAWIPWGGGECPISNNVKRWQYRKRNGFIVENPGFKPENYNWKSKGESDDIIAYRILDSDQSKDTKTEPAWIPWSGGDKSPIVGLRTRYEVEYRDGAKAICVQNTLRWAHTGTAGDIIAYRILEP